MDLQTVLQPLRSILLQWIQRHPLNTKHYSLHDLNNGEFFVYMLSRVQGFRWHDEGNWQNYSEVATGQKVKRMRSVGRSVVRFYQQQLGLSLDHLAFNYIEMCTQSSQNDILRLFVAVLGILVRNQDLSLQLQEFMVELGEDELNIFKTMVSSASKLGEQMNESSQSPIKRQKRLVSKLQSYEEDIDFYEQYTEQLQSKLQKLIEEQAQQRIRMQQFEAQRIKMLNKIEILQDTNLELTKEVSQRTKKQEIMQERLDKNRQAAQDIVDKLVQEQTKYQQQIQHLQKRISQMMIGHQEYNKIKLMCQQKEVFIKEIKEKLKNQIQKSKKLEEQTQILKTQFDKQNFQSIQLRTKAQLYQKTFSLNRNSFFSPEQQSMVFPSRLGDSFIESSSTKQFFTVDEDSNYLAQSLILSQHSEATNYPHQVSFVNHSSPEGESNKQNNDPNILKDIKLNGIPEQKSFEMPEPDSYSPNLRAELELAMNTIFELYSSLRSTRKQLLQFKVIQAKRAERTSKFASKVNSMFQ